MPKFSKASTLSRYIIAVVIAIMLLYLASSGPVLALHFHNSSSGKSLPLEVICNRYRPLFRIAPNAMCRYANMWGISDLELFFWIEPRQLNRNIHTNWLPASFSD